MTRHVYFQTPSLSQVISESFAAFWSILEWLKPTFDRTTKTWTELDKNYFSFTISFLPWVPEYRIYLTISRAIFPLILTI